MKILLFILLFSISVYAQKYMLIAHKDVPELSPKHIKAIFLNKMKSKEHIHFVPVNLNAKDLVRRTFESKYLNMNLQRLKSYWAKQHYLGHRPPHSLKSQNAVIAFVDKVSGSIGYIKETNLQNNNIKIIYTWGE